MPSPSISFDDLCDFDDLATERFPHEYYDMGLGVIGLFLERPPRNFGYIHTPLNSVTFASAGVDGIHFGSLTEEPTFDPENPVVLTIPMAPLIDMSPNYIVGSNLREFLCFGCRRGFCDFVNLHIGLDAALARFIDPPPDEFAKHVELGERFHGILRLLNEQFSLQPLPNLRQRFAELQDKYMPDLRLDPESQI